jgi:hypothetical protein
VSQQTTNRSFDDLARALAQGSISRRGALKLFAGTALAALIPSRALAITCPPGTVKICHIPQRDDGTCRRGKADTRCVTPEAAARHAGHPCDCCGGCGGTDQCREPRPPTCFSTTPMCIPDGGSCTENGPQCCSGNCASGTCAAACASGQVLCNGNCVSNSCLTIGHVFNTSTCQCECPPDRVTLHNGLCAKPCTSNADCPPGCSDGCVPEFSGAQYCATTERRVEGACNSEGPCPEESFCVSGGTECRVAC